MPIASKSYLRRFFLTLGVLLTAVIFFNYWEDPFGIYHAGKPWDWIRSRPDINLFVSLHKAYEVKNAKADILLMGDSRVFNGLDPFSPALPAKTYNLSIPGTRVYENLRYLQHAAASHMPTTVVLGVDLRFFDPDHSTIAEFTEDRLSVRADGQPNPFAVLADWTATLLSAQALKGSLETLLAPTGQRVTYDRGYDANWGEMREHFDEVQRVLAFNTAIASVPSPSHLDFTGHSFEMDAFRDMVKYCALHHIKLIVFVLPLHAFMLDHETADWPTYCGWMETVLQCLADEPGLNSQFWDFTGYNAMSTESFTQPPAQISQTRYYWEYSHFKKPVGDLVLSRIFTGHPELFGRRVTLGTLADDEARLLAEKQNWHRSWQLAPVFDSRNPASVSPVFH